MSKGTNSTGTVVTGKDVADILSIRNTHMVVRLSTGAFGNKKRDQQIARAAERHFGAAHGTCGGDKVLLPTDGILSARRTVIEKFRKGWYLRLTSPWYGGDDNQKDAGRLCSKTGDASLGTGLPGLEAAYNKTKDEVELLDQQFFAVYPKLVQQAKAALAGVYNEADYPTLEEVKERFKFDLDIQPLPDADADFRTGFSDEQAKRLKAKFLKAEYERTEIAMKDLARRMQTAAKVVRDAVARQDVDDKSRLHETVLVHLADMANILPTLNITNDPTIAKVADQISKLNLSHEDLKDDADVRAEVVEATNGVADVLGSLL